MMRVRHYCGELLNIDPMIHHAGKDGEVIAFFPGDDRDGAGIPIDTCPKCNDALDIDFCGTPWLIDPMPFTIASIMSRKKYCSNCWGFDFEMHEARKTDGSETEDFYLSCVNCKEDTIGYVSAGWIDHTKAEDHIYFRDDVEDICNALDIDLPEDYQKKEDRKRRDPLKEMGFW